MHRDIGAELQRSLENRGAPRVIDRAQGVVLFCDLGDRRDVDDTQQWIRRRLEPHELRRWAHGRLDVVEIRHVDERHLEAPRAEDVACELDRTEVRVVGEQHVRTAAE
jgi:hypothetical protein